jgi:signal transduction histidine kinase
MPGHGGAGLDPLDPILVTVRERGFRVFRGVGTAMGLVSLAALVPALLRSQPIGGSGMSIALALAIAFGGISWAIPVRRHQLAAAFLVATVGLIGTLGLWNIGPSLTVGSLVVLVPLLATFFFGRRAAAPGAIAAAVLLAGVGVASWLLGRPAVGSLPGATVPYPIYVRLAVTTFGSVLIALGTLRAALAAMEQALLRARQSAERERAEQERRAAAERSLAHAKRLEAIGQLAGGIAHDTRNALLVMSAGLRELRTAVRSPGDEAVLLDLEHALAGVSRTMQQLLTLGRRQPTSVYPVDLAAVAAAFPSSLRRVIPPEVELRVENGVSARALLDPNRLEQALLNLALNARDAMPAGGVLTLRVRRDRRDGADRAVIEVQDTGGGMDASTAARMFEPFFTTKPAGSGTGLGLLMVQGFVTETGGAIEVDSAVGRGTCVRLLFPAAIGAPATPAAS